MRGRGPWSIAGKTVLITGATNGIGLEAAVALARLGARPILVGRDPGRTAAAVATVRQRAGASAQSCLCDFSSQAEIRRLAAEIRRDHAHLDVLVNNAGGVNKRRSQTVDGIERTFATNHLGYFLLTNLLIDLIKESAPARVVTVASIGHRRATLDLDDLELKKTRYWILEAYERSKIANVLFSNELARRLAGTGVTSNCLHPGRVDTNIWSGAPIWSKPLIALFLRRSFISPEAGAQTILHLAASPELDGVTGKYFEDNVVVNPSAQAQDAATARRLWEISEQLAPAGK